MSEPHGTTPAGWYPDPEGTDERYWDGTAWTDVRREARPAHDAAMSGVDRDEETFVFDDALRRKVADARTPNVAEAGETESEATPRDAGWHPDPRGEGDLRYWDGHQWTDHVHRHEADHPESREAAIQPSETTHSPATAEDHAGTPLAGPPKFDGRRPR